LRLSVAELWLSNRNDLRDFRHFLPQVALDAVLEGHRAAGAAVAGAVEADLNNAVIADADKLDIAAIGLDGGADEVDYPLHLFADIRRFRGLLDCACHQPTL